MVLEFFLQKLQIHQNKEGCQKPIKNPHIMALEDLFLRPSLFCSGFFSRRCSHAHINTHLFHGLLSHVKRCGQGERGGGGGWPGEMGSVHHRGELGVFRHGRLPRPEPVSTYEMQPHSTLFLTCSLQGYGNMCYSKIIFFFLHAADVLIQLAASRLWFPTLRAVGSPENQNQKFQATKAWNYTLSLHD